ncbi:14470_t:CDS:2 [Cetraspora pellucida]|uniref:14470_t:CDS:1 n=1 Tax=Cetraspora pellucida TaxID=1433469 RepID=A0ACA9K5I6_9GLOM|nr:14470_t:CDS:2 [Cetraspora pellucida]
MSKNNEGSDQDYKPPRWSEESVNYQKNENELTPEIISPIYDDNIVVTPPIDCSSVSTDSPTKEYSSSGTPICLSNCPSTLAETHIETSEDTTTTLENNDDSRQFDNYFDTSINHSTLNDRTYFPNYYQYVPHSSIQQTSMTNNNQSTTLNTINSTLNPTLNPNLNTTLNNGGYMMNTGPRIDPSLLNYDNNLTVQNPNNYGQAYANMSVTNNTISNQALYWNEQMSRGLQSHFYGSLPTNTTLGYDHLTQQIINNGRSPNSAAALVTDQALREYMILNDPLHTSKGKKKRGRKPETEYSHIMPLHSPASADGIRQGEIAQCSNCGVRDTPAWRRDLQGVALLCNACGLYLKNKGIHRPTELAPDGTVRLMRTQRPEPEFACNNCGTRNTPCWRGPEGQKLCNKCGLFLKQHGYARPPSPTMLAKFN